MKKLILLSILFIVGCALKPEPLSEPLPEGVNVETLEVRDDGYYTKDTNEPYTGAVFGLYPSGKKLIESYVKDGKENGKFIIYGIDGQIEAEGNYKDGLMNGKWVMYSENGQIEKEGNYKDGNWHGKVTYYKKNGSIKKVEEYKDGEKDGKMTYYKRDGSIKKVKEYKDGEKIN